MSGGQSSATAFRLAQIQCRGSTHGTGPKIFEADQVGEVSAQKEQAWSEALSVHKSLKVEKPSPQAVEPRNNLSRCGLA